MKNLFFAFAMMLAIVSTIGCGSADEQNVVADPSEPLTVEIWKSMSVDMKYDFETLEHLRKSDPKLKNDAQWDRFMAKVVVPERRRDIPTDY